MSTGRAGSGRELTRLSRRAAAAYANHAQRAAPDATASANGELLSLMSFDDLTGDERSLVRLGAGTGVRQLRLEIQDGMSEDLIAIVEDVLDRSVLACMNANHIGPDLSPTTFVLAGAES